MPAFALIWQIASTILVWGRFYLRVKRLAGPFGFDDAFMLVAWVCLEILATKLEIITNNLPDELGHIHWHCLAYDYKPRS